MIASAAVAYWFNIPAFLIGIPAMCIPVFVWAYFVDTRTPKGRR